jgi:hypothetical protein
VHEIDLQATIFYNNRVRMILMRLAKSFDFPQRNFQPQRIHGTEFEPLVGPDAWSEISDSDFSLGI